MPKLEEALYTYLTTDPGVSALVDDRIYPFRLPEGTQLPAIAWQRISAQRIYTFDPFPGTNPWVQARIQFSCWSHIEVEAIQVGEAILAALSGYTGDMSGEYVGSSFADFELDDYEEKTKLYRRLVDFLITYEDELPTAS